MSDTFDKYFREITAKVVLRETYKGRAIKPEMIEFNGKIFTFHYGWTMDGDDPYPGEIAWLTDSALIIGWIASGDLQIIEETT